MVMKWTTIAKMMQFPTQVRLPWKMGIFSPRLSKRTSDEKAKKNFGAEFGQKIEENLEEGLEEAIEGRRLHLGASRPTDKWTSRDTYLIFAIFVPHAVFFTIFFTHECVRCHHKSRARTCCKPCFK